MKLKKLITLAIALVLTTTQALAESSDDLLEKLKAEKSFVLKVLISPWAGRTIWDLGSNKKIFYVTDCNGKCKTERVGVLSALKKFAQDYNQTLGREYIIVNSNITSGNSNHHTQVELIQNLINGAWTWNFKCDDLDKKKKIDGFCHIKLSTKLKPNLNYYSALLAIHTLGIYANRNNKHKNCLVYEPPYNGNFLTLTNHRKNGYQGMCENEKRTIVFLDKYLKADMRIKQVEEMFDKHWVSDTTLALDKIDPNWKEKEIVKAFKKAITKKTFSTQPSGNR